MGTLTAMLAGRPVPVAAAQVWVASGKYAAVVDELAHTEALLLLAEQRVAMLETDKRHINRDRQDLRSNLDEAEHIIANQRRELEHLRKLAGIPELPF